MDPMSNPFSPGAGYFLQEWGYQSWNLAPASPIGVDVVHRATSESIRRLEANFFRVRFDRLTPREKQYLRALADMGETVQRSGEIAERLGVKVQSIAPVRNGLIKKGMIYSPAHGDTAFTVPLFADFMKRARQSAMSQPAFPLSCRRNDSSGSAVESFTDSSTKLERMSWTPGIRTKTVRA